MQGCLRTYVLLSVIYYYYTRQSASMTVKPRFFNSSTFKATEKIYAFPFRNYI